jgi:hypothetical protein
VSLTEDGEQIFQEDTNEAGLVEKHEETHADVTPQLDLPHFDIPVETPRGSHKPKGLRTLSMTSTNTLDQVH